MTELSLPPRVRVLIAEDDDALREALADLVRDEPTLELVGVARDAEDAIQLTLRSRPDVALLDVKMPAGGGTRAAREIAEQSPLTKIVAHSAYEDRGAVLQMLRSGATAYLVKGTPVEEVIESILRAARGQGTLSAEVTGEVISELAGHLEREGELSERHQRQVEEIRQVLEGDGLNMVFQPIADLRSRRVVGLEALARFAIEPFRGPDVWFAQAAETGLLRELELAAVEAAFADLDRLPPGAYLSVNVSPETAISPGFTALLETVPSELIVVEITEHWPIENYEALARALGPLRSRGVRLAIDDAGAGFATLRHILQLNPDVIKLDISLTRGIDTERRRRALAAALISFAGEIDASVVAEGVETEAELETLLDLGASLGQGYFLARPGALPVEPYLAA